MSQSGEQDCKDITITLVDPCDPPTSVVAPTVLDQSYTLTDDAAANYLMAEPTITPSFCKYTTSIVVSPLNDGASAVTHVDNLFSFFYTKDLKPIRPTE